MSTLDEIRKYTQQLSGNNATKYVLDSRFADVDTKSEIKKYTQKLSAQTPNTAAADKPSSAQIALRPKATAAIVKPTTGAMSARERYKPVIPETKLSQPSGSLMGKATNAPAGMEDKAPQRQAEELTAKIAELQHQQDIYFDPSREEQLKAAKQQYKELEDKLQKTTLAGDTVGKGAGMFNQGAANFADFVSNAIPRVEGWLMGVEPEETFTGQLLKPATKATGAVKDYVDTTVAKIDENAAEKIGDSKAKQTAYNLGSNVVAALPQAILAMASGGASAATQLPAQTSGISATVMNAATKALNNPMTKLSFAQSLGNSYEEAKAQGATDMEAIVSATISSYVNAMVETSGGIDALPNEIRDLDLTTPQKVWEWVKSALDEGKEEVVQNVITKLTNKGVFAEDTPLFSATDENAVFNPNRMVGEFATGTAVGGILGGGQVLAQSGINAATKTDSRYNEMMRDLDSIMPRLPQEQSAASQTAQEAAVPNAPNTAPTETNVAQGTADDAVSAVLPNVAEHRDTATQILNDGIFDSPTYGDALEQTGMKRSDVRQALRKIAQNTPGADADAEVRSVVNAIVNAEAQPQTQTAVEPETVETAQEAPITEAQQPVEAEQPETAEANPAMGAADYGFSPYSNYQNTQSQFIPEGANAARPVDLPKTDPKGNKTRKFASNAMGAKAVPERGVEQMQNDFMEGRYGYEVQRDETAVRKANELINSTSFDYAKAQTIERLQMMKNLKQTVVDAEVLVAKAYREGRDADAAELCYLLIESGTEFGQAVQALSILRKLTPEGQLEGLQRTVKRLNEKIAGKGGKRKTIADSTKEQIIDAIEGVREDALQMLESIGDTPESKASVETSAEAERGAAVRDASTKRSKARKTAERNHGLEVENWMTAVGKEVAKALDAKPKAQTPKPISRIIRQDILNLAKKHWPQAPKAQTVKRTAADTITDFFANRDKYVEAWNAALEEYRKMHGLGEDFAGPAGAGAEPMMLQAVVDEATAQALKKQKIELFSYLGDQASIEKQLADGLIKRTGATGDDADTIRRAVSQYVRSVLYDANIERIGNGLDRDIRKVVEEIGGSMYEIVRDNKGNKAGAAKIVANMMVKRYGISKDAAQAASAKIVERFNAMIAQKTQKALDAIFADKKKAEPRSAAQKITELGNLGAFESEAYKGKAADKAKQYVDTDIKKAVKAIGKDAAEIIRSSPADKKATAERIKQMLMEKHRLHEADAKRLGDFIVDRFNQMVSDRSKTALENMFKERGKKVPKTFDQRFAELANMGAFTGEFSEAASEMLFGEGVYVKKELSDKFLAAPDEASRNEVLEEIYQDIGQQMPTTAGEIANQWRYTAMLLNPSTHLKNIAGNATQLAESSIKDVFATVGEIGVDAASKVLRKGKGIERTKAFLNRRSSDDLNLLAMAESDYENVMDDIQGTGKYKDTAEGKIGEYRDIMKLNNPEGKVAKAVDAMLRGAGKAADWNSDIMNREDIYFSKKRYTKTLASYMKANGLTDITDDARAYAIKEAQKATYRDANAISNFAKSMGHSKSKAWNFIVNAIFPFKATPANVGVRAVEYSPVGLLTTIGKAARDAYRGEFKAANFIDDLSANLTGTALSAVGILLARMGVLKAKGTGDEQEKEQLAREGYKQNSVTLFGYDIPISALGAGSIPLLFGASVYENFFADNPDSDDATFDSFLEALSGTLDPVMETTMLSGLQDALQTFQGYNPNAGIAKQFGMGLIDVAGNYVASFIPTLLSRIANATDTAARQTYIDKNKDAQKLQGEVQAWQKKVPGLRNQMTAQIDAYGNEVAGGWSTEGNAAERVAKAVASIITPTYPSKIKTTAVDEELHRIYDNTTLDKSDTPVFTNDAPKSFGVNGETVYLTGKQYEQFAKTRNSGIQKMQSDVMSSELYADLPVEVQHRAMHDAKSYAEALAKAELGVGYELKEPWMKELVGLSPEEATEAIITKSIEGEAKSYEGGKYDGLSSMLSEGSIDDEIAISLLPEETFTKYEEYGKKYKVTATDLMDALAYKNSADAKAVEGDQKPQDRVKEFIKSHYSNNAVRRGIWCCLYAESSCPW